MPNKKIGLIVFMSVITLAYACNNGQSGQENTTEVVDTHTSENSLDWDGSYSGTLPCADCEGIETQLTLDQDKHYTLISRYEAEGETPDTSEGTFSWGQDGSTITLDGIEEGINTFRVEENRVRVLDQDGKIIEGALADYYVLDKE